MLRLLAAGVAFVHADKATPGKSPLISTEVLYGTYEILADAGSHAYKMANVEGLIAQIPIDNIKKEVLKQTGPIPPLPPQVDDAVLQATAAYVQVKSLVMEHTQKAYKPMNDGAVGLIEKFEKQFPSYKGLIPKTLGNFVLFVCYKFVVLYVVLKVLLFILRTVFGITSCVICCICCCRCCRSKKPAAKSTKKPNGKTTEAKPKPAVAPAGKVAPKAATKKK